MSTAPHDRRARATAAAVVALALVAVFHPMLRGRAVFHRDIALWLAPARAMVREAFARGRLPAWSPWEGLGFPVPADPLYGTFYPLAALTLPLPVGWGETVYLFLHVLLGGAGLAALARRAGLSPQARAIGALTWMLTGLTCSHWSLGVLLPPQAWIPWCCAFALDLARGDAPPSRAALKLGLGGAMLLLSGEFYVALMGALPVFALALAGSRDGSSNLPISLRHRAIALTAAGLLALALAAPVWLPAVSLVAGTARAEAMSTAAVDRWSLPPVLLADVLVPRGLVARWMGTHDPALATRFGDHLFYFALYAGSTALGLALIALRRRGSALAWTALGLVLLGVLLALGPATPLLPALRAVVRPFAHMRTPQKFLILAHTPFALLAALGAERALRGETLRAMLVYPLALGVATLAVHRASPAAVPGYVLSGVNGLLRVAILLGAIALVRRRPRQGFVLTLAVALDLGHGAWTVFAWTDAPAPGPPPLAALVHAAPHRAGAGPPRLWWSNRLRYEGTRSADAEARALLTPKTHLGTGIAVVPGYDAAIAEEVDRLAYSGRLGAVRFLAADLALAASPSLPGLRWLATLRPGAHLHAVNAPLPRAFVAHAALEDPPGPRLWHLIDEPVLRGEQIALRRNDLETLPDRAPSPPSGCTFARWAPGEVSLRCSARVAGVAVLAEQFSPGWQATLDGRAARVLRVNRVMLGVRIPAGDHTLRFTFVTPGQTAGLALAALGLVASLGWVLRLRTKPGAPSSEPRAD